jgi:putative ABC transport system permease protein
MNTAYLFSAIFRRPARAVTAMISVALGIALFISLQAYAKGYRQAARAPCGNRRGPCGPAAG